MIALTALVACASGQPARHACAVAAFDRGLRLKTEAGVIDLELLRENVLRVDVQPDGKKSPRTLVLDPGLKAMKVQDAVIRAQRQSGKIATRDFSVVASCGADPAIAFYDNDGHELIRQSNPLEVAHSNSAVFERNSDENLYGMSGLSMGDDRRGLLRNSGSAVAAGQQGEGGAPWFFTTHYGILIDSDGGKFTTKDRTISFSGISRKDCEYFFMAGSPMQTVPALAEVTGRPPLPPKWALGFLNSQWGSTEDELTQIVATYRAKHSPLDAFILDFDWKAWGEDHYGEWRWNSTSAAGNIHGGEFPDGASGQFAAQMRAQGVKLAGILKPRILLYKPGSKTELDEASAYADEHGLWYPGEPKTTDYFTGRAARDLDFSNARTRSWYWQHLAPAFHAGMVGWWNDEQDVASGDDGKAFPFDSFQGLNMGRMLYEGQRADSNLRTWSINRNTYLGAQRYGYALWSGDITTGFESMAQQRMRMLATLDLGQPHWSMDTGGFHGHPSAENFARWIEFATFVPIDRVHGDIGEKRQPWRYGTTAEEAATNAIRLRYRLLPYIYSYERVATETGVGIVRPLFWAYPDDARVANDGDEWMFGDALLVSPVVKQGETEHQVYLPAGTWFDYFTGREFHGGETIRYPVDPVAWRDIPVFVRAGSMIASQPEQDYVDQKPATEVTLDIFPGTAASKFVYYDDDGSTYAYEQGVFYRQEIRALNCGHALRVELGKPTGTFHPALQTFLIRVHGASVRSIERNGKRLAGSKGDTVGASPKEGEWAAGSDKFGPVVNIRVRGQEATTLVLHE